MRKDSLHQKQTKPSRNKLTLHPSMIKKWDIYNAEFYAAITKNAFWQNGGLDMTDSTETNPKCGLKKKKKNKPLKCMMCRQESKLYLEASN